MTKVNTAEAKKLIENMTGKIVGLTVGQSTEDNITSTEIRITGTHMRPKQTLCFYAAADPDCYSDLSEVSPLSRNGFTLDSAVLSDKGIRLIIEDRKSGVKRQIRVILSKKNGCTCLMSFEVKKHT